MAHKWDPPLFSLDEDEKKSDPLLSQIHQEKSMTKKVSPGKREPVTVNNPPKGEGWELQDIVLIIDGEQRASKAWFKKGAIGDFLKQNDDPEVRKQTLFVPNKSDASKAVSAVQLPLQALDQFNLDTPPTTSLLDDPFDNFDLEPPFAEDNLFNPLKDPFQNDISEFYSYQEAEPRYEYNYQCEKCGNEFKTQTELNTHKKIHLKRRFACHICGHNCANSSLLEEHILAHSKPKPIVCRYPKCTKTFNSKVALVAHYRAHSREQKFSCDFCGRHFTNSCHVKSHMRKMHPETDWLYPDSEVKQLFNNYHHSGHTQFL